MGEAKRRQQWRQRQGAAPVRVCGGCTLCCKLVNVEEIDKPGGSYCPHCTVGQGCQIQQTKPPSCAEWQCLWLHPRTAGLFSEAQRPDRCGYLFKTAGSEELPSIQIVVDRASPRFLREPLAIAKETVDIGTRLLDAGAPMVSFHFDRSDGEGVALSSYDEMYKRCASRQ